MLNVRVLLICARQVGCVCKDQRQTRIEHPSRRGTTKCSYQLLRQASRCPTSSTVKRSSSHLNGRLGINPRTPPAPSLQQLAPIATCQHQPLPPSHAQLQQQELRAPRDTFRERLCGNHKLDTVDCNHDRSRFCVVLFTLSYPSPSPESEVTWRLARFARPRRSNDPADLA